MKSNDQYVSLYDYSGNPSRSSGIGRKVYEAAKEKNIHVIYTDLPPDLARPEYNRVATYPKWFLDEYFGKTTVSVNELTLEERVTKLEKLLSELTNNTKINVTNNNEYDNDELPF